MFAVNNGTGPLPPGKTEQEGILAIEGDAIGDALINLSSWTPNAYTQMYFTAAADLSGNYSHRYQLGVGNATESGIGVANKFFMYDGGPCPSNNCSGGRGLLYVADALPTTPVHTFYGTVRVAPQTADPVCTGGGDLGKVWNDNNDANTMHHKICSVTSGTFGWVTVF
jgi:hypothetical protein